MPELKTEDQNQQNKSGEKVLRNLVSLSCKKNLKSVLIRDLKG